VAIYAKNRRLPEIAAIMIFIEQKLKIYGLPRSGTNFFEFMLAKNFHVSNLTFEFGWKHGPPISKMPYKSLFIIKNPYAWLRSIFLYALRRERIFHITSDINFHDFLRRQYIWDSDMFGPYSSKVFQQSKNPIIHWNNLNKQWLESSVLVRYEDLLANTNKIFKRLELEEKLKRRTANIMWPSKEIKPGQIRVDTSNKNYYKKTNYYLEKKYMRYFTEESLRHIENFIDKDLLKRFCYNQE